MAAVQNVGIVGAGAAGLTAAILLADAGVQVEILEKADAPQTLGSGITLQGNALRVLRQLGVWEQIEAKGYAFSTLGLRAPDPAGTVIAVLEDMRTGGDDLPATLGMYRPDLTAILRERAEQAGARISYGKTVTEITDDGGSVTVSTSDGGTAPLRPPDRRRRPALSCPQGHRHRRRTPVHGHGHLARVRGTAAGRGPHRPDLRRPLLHRRLLPHRPGHHLRLPRRKGPGAQTRGRPAHHGRTRRSLRRPMERDPRQPGPERPYQLHLVHYPPGGRAVEPRPHRHHRRRRPQLPAHHRAGCCHGPGRRSRAGRTADRRRRRSPRHSGKSSPTADWTGQRQWSTPPSSWASGCSTASGTPTCRASCIQSPAWLGSPHEHRPC